MAKIWTINNKDEKKLLRRKLKSFDFSQHSSKEINKLIKEMDDSMQKANGIGLSANQIGLDMRIFVARWDNKFFAVFNPKIEKRSKEKETMEEGCLSIPKQYGEVSRSENIVLIGQNKQGKKIKIRAWGMLATIFQHEIDHLNGKLFTDRMKRGVKLRGLE
ncbi:MAG: peptide deformylase [Candidatus Colwellbacteria bacterium CG10_big_fil_rev_8_21_14_0_10_42_22]|uniref:Peptide deformylase n=1 Tax=Candidatus Colwellbacteria bacterium CG10_big_fil_rev_8_21_14_0_10_42_22 TaxID=1974540 RepID=A0A2H0VIC4_9BACT|nr:MAG: peptide deformylase [Candidatus Colwellbacteria bacterium CG10_big_fil_rev_8_21_14_0_10_42_22]